jgi:hypothetical protein
MSEKQISIAVWTVFIIMFTANFFFMIANQQPFLAVVSLFFATVTLWFVRYIYRNE